MEGLDLGSWLCIFLSNLMAISLQIIGYGIGSTRYITQWSGDNLFFAKARVTTPLFCPAGC